MLLPHTEMQGDEDEIEDPRLSLVKQLLEYKRYKECTLRLASGLLSGKKSGCVPTTKYLMNRLKKEAELPLECIGAWDAIQRFFPN